MCPSRSLAFVHTSVKIAPIYNKHFWAMYWMLVPSLQIQTLELNMKIMRNTPNPYNRKVAKAGL